MAKSKVAVLKTRPETILEDIHRLMSMAGFEQTLQKGATTILKDNISWHFPFPAANTTPWQMEGTVLSLKKAGYNDIVCVQNKTVVTNAFKGEDLNNYVPIFKRYQIPVFIISKKKISGGFNIHRKRGCMFSIKFIQKESRYRNILSERILFIFRQ